MKRVFVVLLALMLLTGCGKEEPVSEVAESVELAAEAMTEATDVVEEPVVEVEEVTETQVETPGSDLKTLSSLEEFTDLLDKAVDDFDRITEEEEDMALLGDSMFIGMVGMKLLNVQLDSAMRMSETWEDLEAEMPNGRGTSDSTMTMEEGLYIYDYANKWDMDYEDTIHMVFDPAKMTVDYLGIGGNPNNGISYHQQYKIDEDGNLLMTVVEYGIGDGVSDQMVLFYNGAALNYGRSSLEGDGLVDLEGELVADNLATWEDLKALANFSTLFEYDGSKLTYTHE